MLSNRVIWSNIICVSKKRVCWQSARTREYYHKKNARRKFDFSPDNRPGVIHVEEEAQCECAGKNRIHVVKQKKKKILDTRVFEPSKISHEKLAFLWFSVDKLFVIYHISWASEWACWCSTSPLWLSSCEIKWIKFLDRFYAHLLSDAGRQSVCALLIEQVAIF